MDGIITQISTSTELILKFIEQQSQPSVYDYVVLVVTTLSVAMSFLAVYVAVKMPQKIADEQNKIALFEKRYDILSEIDELLEINRICNEIKLSILENNIDDLKTYMILELSSYIFEGTNKSVSLFKYVIKRHDSKLIVHSIPDYDKINLYILQYSSSKLELINKAELLFNKELSADFAKITRAILALFYNMGNDNFDNLNEKRNNLRNCCKSFEEKHMENIKKQIKL